MGLLALLPASASCAAPDAPTPDATSALLTRLARPAPQTTTFVEVRYSKLLDEPLTVTGELDYRGADQLARRVETPFRETTTIAGESVTLARDGERERRFSLKRAPELRGVLTSFGALLSGDAAALRRFFEVALTGDDGAWTLTLTPRDAKMRKRVAQVVVDGADTQPRCFTVREGDGDESVMLVDALAREHANDAGTMTREALGALCRATPPAP
jgi:hypothetical protein